MSICAQQETIQRDKQMTMRIIPTEIQDVLILEPRVFSDSRGFFLETYNERTLQPWA